VWPLPLICAVSVSLYMIVDLAANKIVQAPSFSNP
jgi:hypothetical protein